MIKVITGELKGTLVLVPDVFADARGLFMEAYNERDFAKATGLAPRFVQDNYAKSARGVLRGLHYQVKRVQGKLVHVTRGRIFDVALDVRAGSPTYGRWSAVVLSGANRHLHWIPEGCAHGYLVLSATADVLYKVTDYRAPEHERAIHWKDPDLTIEWPLRSPPILSARDAAAPPFADAEAVR